jgi:hypothetical protein
MQTFVQNTAMIHLQIVGELDLNLVDAKWSSWRVDAKCSTRCVSIGLKPLTARFELQVLGEELLGIKILHLLVK